MNATRSKIAPFPGTACAFHQAGRCLYEERLNPGLDASVRCAALVACEAAFDGFLTQADNFGLSDGKAVAIWERRFAELAVRPPDCGSFTPAPDSDYPGCALFHDDLCLALLPPCRGVCENYRRTERGHGDNPNKSSDNA